jgi:hypothetical protein
MSGGDGCDEGVVVGRTVMMVCRPPPGAADVVVVVVVVVEEERGESAVPLAPTGVAPLLTGWCG